MSALPYMPLYVADYLADTAHLSALENGAYLMLIMNYWQRGNPLPSGDAQLARIARLTPEEWQAVRPALAEFFTEENGQWIHGRIEVELAKVKDKSTKASNAGKASAKRKVNKRSTDVEQTFNHTDTDRLDDVGCAREDVSRETIPPPTDDMAGVERLLRQAAGWEREPHPNLFVLGPVMAALDNGVDLNLDLIPAARAYGPQITSRSSWDYILKAAVTAKNKRLGAASDAARPISVRPGKTHHAKPSTADFVSEFINS